MISFFISSLLFIVTLHSQAAIPQKWLFTGSSTVAPVAAELSKAFEKKHPLLRIDVQTGGSTKGAIDTLKSLNDMGMISRKPHSGTEQTLKTFLLAKDGIAMIVHQSNPLTNLSHQEVQKIYKRQITNWKALGGPDAPIILVHKAEGHSTLELFLKHFRLKRSEVKPHIVIGDNEQGIKTVAGNPHAIGYVSIGAALHNISLKTPIKMLKLDGITPSLQNVQNGQYPLQRPLYFVYKKSTPLIEEFLSFCRSHEAHQIIQKFYFLPIH